jgi:hypothetical protein
MVTEEDRRVKREEHSLSPADPCEDILKAALRDTPVCYLKAFFACLHLYKEALGIESRGRNLWKRIG